MAVVLDEVKKERLVVAITTLACITCTVKNYIDGWEFWMPPLLIAGVLVLWYLHLSQKTDFLIRCNIYFVYSAILVFYYGVHHDSLYDIAVVMMLLMSTYTLLDRVRLLDITIVEYALIMCVQFYFLYQDKTTNLDLNMIIKIAFHEGTVIALYILSRAIIRSRLTAAEKLAKWQDTVSENNNDMEDFLSNISHELRTPVNVISGMTAILRKNSDKEELDSIQEATLRLSHQIEDIQDYTELKRDQLVIVEENYMCISLINDIVCYFKAKDKENRLELVVDLSPDMPVLLCGDITKLHKLFRHLLDNAIKFTKRGGVYIRVYSIPREYGINLMIEVTDTGIGMTRAAMSKVSKGMYQANKKRNRSTGGIGIGLPITYGFVHKMGGFVRINSIKGSGTTVRVSIPQKVVDPSPCLSIKEELKKGIVMYMKPEKYKVPAIREFYTSMTVNLATGLHMKLYSASQKRELENLTADLNISHIFTGQEEYEAESAMFNYLSSKGVKVIVTANTGFVPEPGSGIYVIPKPLYGFPLVRILNGENDADTDEERGVISFNGVRALVVDDEPMNLVVASGLLKNYGMSVDTAESGKEAISKYEKGEYDVIYMDHMMPEMDGVEAQKRLRQIADKTLRHPVIIALTANALSGAREMFMREGFDGFIAKPVDIGEFERVMKNVLPEDPADFEGRDLK